MTNQTAPTFPLTVEAAQTILREVEALRAENRQLRRYCDNYVAQRDNLSISLTTACQELAITVRALNHIAYDPIGPAEATYREVLDGAVEIAKAALIAVVK